MNTQVHRGFTLLELLLALALLALAAASVAAWLRVARTGGRQAAEYLAAWQARRAAVAVVRDDLLCIRGTWTLDGDHAFNLTGSLSVPGDEPGLRQVRWELRERQGSPATEAWELARTAGGASARLVLRDLPASRFRADPAGNLWLELEIGEGDAKPGERHLLALAARRPGR